MLILSAWLLSFPSTCGQLDKLWGAADPRPNQPILSLPEIGDPPLGKKSNEPEHKLFIEPKMGNNWISS